MKFASIPLRRLLRPFPALVLSVVIAFPWPGATAGSPPGQGTLLARTEASEMIAVPLKHTDVRVDIAGNLAEVEVTHIFHNPYDRKIEALYLFPLPDRAAVNFMEIKLENRTIRSVLKRRDEARKVYEDARARGRMAALLDQERPNVFTHAVANILPGSEVVVMIRYYETVPYAGGAYAFTFPMVVGPRYTAGAPDAHRITAPGLAPGLRPGHDIVLEVHLDAGTTAREIVSPSHPIDVESDGRGGDVIRLRREEEIPDRDFILRYRLNGRAPELIVLSHRVDSSGYLVALIQPEAAPLASHIAPKELIFVVDCSGSMSGPPIEKAKEAMQHALGNLNPLDTFQVVTFSDHAEAFAPAPVLATQWNLQRARDYVDRLAGSGGTIMIEGVRLALSYPRDPDRLRIISFMTDGFIGNEAEILAYLERNLGGARLFSLGVGASVNRYLLDRMAEFGRGTVEYLLLRSGTGEPMERFYDRIHDPYLTDITLEWGGLEVTDVHPSRLPDLFLGRPVVVHGRYRRPGAGQVILRANLGGMPFERRFVVRLAERDTDGTAIATLWARARIEELSHLEMNDPQPAREQELLEVAFAHNLISGHTSFVAVEERIDTGAAEPTVVAVPLPIPGSVEPRRATGESVTVSAGASTAEFAAEFVETLPIQGRNLQDPLKLAPAVGDLVEGVVGGALAGAKGARDVDVSTLTDGASSPVKTEEVPAIPHVEPARLLCRIQSAQVIYRLGEIIEVIMTVRNPSDRHLLVPESLTVAGGARFLIVDDRGQTLKHPTGEIEVDRRVPVSPSGTVSFRVTLNGPGGYPIDRAGTYRIVFLGSDLGIAESNILVLTIDG
jgi:Ca-activated chloride channel family protein